MIEHNDEFVPILSIVIPVYNVGEYISQCLDSLLSQKLDNIEILCVIEDDITGSVGILEKYTYLDSRIRIVRTDRKGGINYSRKIGYKASSGKYITFVDGDDWVENDIFNVLLEDIQKNDAEIAIYDYLMDFDNGKKKRCPKIEKEWVDTENNRLNLVLSCICFKCHPLIERTEAALFNKIYSRKLFERIDDDINFLPDIIHYEDGYHNMLCIQKAKKIRFIDIVGYHQRRDKKGSSASFRYRKTLPPMKDILFYMAFQDNFGDESSKSKYRKAMYTMLVNLFFSYVAFCHFFRKENPNTFLEQMNQLNVLLNKKSGPSADIWPIREAIDGCEYKWVTSNSMRFLMRKHFVTPTTMYLLFLWFRIKIRILGHY